MNKRRVVRLFWAVAWATAAAAAAAGARNAPDFTLPTPDGRQITLSSLRGKLVVIEFLSPT